MGIQSVATTTIIILFASIAFGEKLPSEVQTQAISIWAKLDSYQTNSPVTMAKIRALPDEERTLLLIYYRGEWEKYERQRPSGGDQLLLRLAMLGDPDARDRVVASWVRGRGFQPKTWQPPDDLLLLESPEAIPQIGELLFMNEEYQVPSDVGYLPPQGSALLVVLNTLQKAPAFDGPLRVWANELLSLRNGTFVFRDNALGVVRAWYRENETLLKKGDFQAVQPGRMPVEVEANQPLSAPPSVNLEPEQSVTITPTPEATHELAPSEWTFAAIAAGCLVLLVGLVFWKRRFS